MLPLYLAMIDTDEDRTKFAALYERYSRLMFYIARQILSDEQLSEDAVQEAFLRIAKNMHKVGDVSCPQTRNFSVIITRNVAITMKKQNAYDFETDIAALEYRTKNDDELFNTLSQKLLAECILKLPDIYRDTLYLYHLYGYSFPEISNLLSVSVETVKKRAQRARDLLRRMIEEEGYGYESPI